VLPFIHLYVHLYVTFPCFVFITEECHSPAVQSVIEMGYSEDVIRQAIDISTARHHKQNSKFASSYFVSLDELHKSPSELSVEDCRFNLCHIKN